MNQLERIIYFMSIKIGPRSLGEVNLGSLDLPQHEI
jgi:hypothetical protein